MQPALRDTGDRLLYMSSAARKGALTVRFRLWVLITGDRDAGSRGRASARGRTARSAQLRITDSED